MIVPPLTVIMRASGLWTRKPEGPEKQDVAASPRVGAMIAIQWGVSPGRQGGPLTWSAMYLAHASVLPAPRPAFSTQPRQSPGGGTWWGSGTH